jgi:hypothetical protein
LDAQTIVSFLFREAAIKDQRGETLVAPAWESVGMKDVATSRAAAASILSASQSTYFTTIVGEGKKKRPSIFRDIADL